MEVPMDTLLLLVPKLCLGTYVAKLRFAVPRRARVVEAKQSFADWVSEQSLGTRTRDALLHPSSCRCLRAAHRHSERWPAPGSSFWTAAPRKSACTISPTTRPSGAAITIIGWQSSPILGKSWTSNSRRSPRDYPCLALRRIG